MSWRSGSGKNTLMSSAGSSPPSRFCSRVGLAIYFLIPTNPPWLSDDSTTAAAPTVSRVMETVADRLGGGLYQASYAVVGESNPIAAMPSIHLAVTFLLIFPAGYFGKRWRLLAMFYALSMGIALVYLGEHYVTDVFVGGVVASLPAGGPRERGYTRSVHGSKPSAVPSARPADRRQRRSISRADRAASPPEVIVTDTGGWLPSGITPELEIRRPSRR